MFKIGLDCISKLIFSAGSVGTSKRYMYMQHNPINLVDYLSDGTQELFQFIQTERYHSSFLGRCYIYPAEFSTEYNKDGLFRCHDLTHKTVSTMLMNASFFLFGLQTTVPRWSISWHKKCDVRILETKCCNHGC